MVRPPSPPSSYNSPLPTDHLLPLSSGTTPAASPRPDHASYDISPPASDHDGLNDKELDQAIALLEARRKSSSLLPGGGGQKSSAAGAGGASLGAWATGFSRKLSQRTLSRRALVAVMLLAVLGVSLVAHRANSDALAEQSWTGRYGELRAAGGRWKDKAMHWASKGMIWTANGAAEDDDLVYEELDVLKVLNFDTPQETLRSQLKTGVRYVTAMAYGGHANQMISIMRMLYFAKMTNRVGIIPTLIPIHVDGPPVPMSTFYDMGRFWSESRVAAVEFTQVKPLDLASERPQNEHISCWSVQEATVGFANLEAWSFDLHDIWVDHWPLPPLSRGLGGFDLAFDALRVFDFDQWAKQDWIGRVQRESLPQMPPATAGEVFTGDKTKNLKPGFDPAHTTPPDDQLMCFDNTLFLGPVMFPELPVTAKPLEANVPGEGLSWMNVGQHLRFNADVESKADEYLMRLFSVSSPAKLPPFITIHLRRGDFKDFTGYTGLEKYVAALERVRTALQARLDAPDAWTGPGRKAFRTFGRRADEYEVVCTTDERGDSDFVKEVRALGWKVLDHDAFQTKENYDGWMPTMLDGAILARGRSFVGTDRSTFSHMAGLRVKYWRGGLVETAV
ncbi:hypothetical protein JCM10207_004011 [Rhodosporidiobolus poonsookiae]